MDIIQGQSLENLPWRQAGQLGRLPLEQQIVFRLAQIRPRPTRVDSVPYIQATQLHPRIPAIIICYLEFFLVGRMTVVVS